MVSPMMVSVIKATLQKTSLPLQESSKTEYPILPVGNCKFFTSTKITVSIATNEYQLSSPIKILQQSEV